MSNVFVSPLPISILKWIKRGVNNPFKKITTCSNEICDLIIRIALTLTKRGVLVHFGHGKHKISNCVHCFQLTFRFSRIRN